MRAADQIVESLKAHGIKRAYCVPGESYLALLDAFAGADIEVIVCRHEGGAGFMACAEAKLTGRPALFLTSRGPGATNGSIAIHMADQDALPVIMMVGQVSREERTRGVFQEVDYTQFLGSMCKGVFEVNDGNKLHELLPRGIRLATEGTPGPVVFSLPEDMLNDDVPAQAPVVFPSVHLGHGAADIAHIHALIARAERPLIVAGAMLRGAKGASALARAADALRIPVAVTWKNQDVFDNTSPLYAGHLGFGIPKRHRDVVAEADLLIAIGTRLGDVASLSYSVPETPSPRQTLIHIYPDGKPLGHVFRTDFALLADPASVLTDLGQEARVVTSAREAWISRINGEVRALQKFTPVATTDGIDFGIVIETLSRLAPRDAIITTDAGNMSTWVHRHWPMTPANTLIGGIVGAMGLGVPAAIAASLEQPHRAAICIVGDGGVLMTGNELATAMAFGAAPKVVLSDNGIYGTIRTHQEREYPGRVSGTNLTNPDFAVWAKCFGAYADTLAQGDDVEAKLKSFLAAKGPALLHVKSSAVALSANGQLKTGA